MALTDEQCNQVAKVYMDAVRAERDSKGGGWLGITLSLPWAAKNLLVVTVLVVLGKPIHLILRAARGGK
jgi:hypothetical protein